MINLILMLISRAANVCGLQFLACAFLFRMVALGQGPLGISYLGLCATVCSLASAYPLGWVVDRLTKRQSIFASNSALLVTSVGIYFFHPETFVPLLIASSVVAVTRNFRSISQFTVFGELLAQTERKTLWVNLSTLSWQVAAVAAPICAGLLGGGITTLAYALGFFILSSICQIKIASSLMSSREVSPPLSQISKLIQTNYKIRSALFLDFIVVLFAGVTSLLPFLHSDFCTPYDIGLLRAVLPAGIIVGTLFRLYKPGFGRWDMTLCAATFAYGVFHLLLAESHLPALSIVLLFGAGICDAVSLSIRETLLQLETPPALKGRLYAFNNFLVNASDELSEWESGLAAQLMGLRTAIRVGGSLAIFASGIFAYTIVTRENSPS